MAENKTKATKASVESYLAAIPSETRQRDCRTLASMIAKVTREKPTMWGTSIIGFGSRHYKYGSGREGDTCIIGFASRKNDIAIYGLGAMAVERPELVLALGKHKMGKGCLYLSNLGEVNAEALEQLVARSYSQNRTER